MKTVISILFFNLVALCLVGTASYMAIHDMKGWGWFLIGGMLTTVTSVKQNDKG